MPRTKADEAVAAERREKVAVMYLSRRTQREIGLALGVDHGTVCRDLKVIQKTWQESAVSNFEARKAEELARIDALERTYLDAWDRSKQDAEMRTEKVIKEPDVSTNGPDGTKVTPGAVKTETTERKEGQSGNPAFLAGVLSCIDQRCKIIGLYAPKTLRVSDVSDEDIERAVEAELNRVARLEAGGPEAVPGEAAPDDAAQGSQEASVNPHGEGEPPP